MDYEKKIDIPFGAHDSELKGWEYTIPEGMEAIIKDGKVIVREKESEDERMRKMLIERVRSAEELTDELREWILTYLEKQKERGPLTKDEEYILHRIIEYLENETCPSEWISLLHDIYCLPYEKQKEQKPAEWSEEDERMLEVISYKISQHQGNDERSLFTPDEAEFICGMEDKLKSLRPSWKPSEEQMEALLWCTAHLGGADHRVLAELYEHLKMYCL